ncbi:hypothetical protein QR680_008357 [Steinernema hermaphroditum]|uniref:EF-hand domain-containing protein n=1 Tax=Steinernema hermaphroditum TaxID=289476 RepID=A0AA39IGB5_9BILA|nr:hypothetical protein QR680_008357 [Steinernema hermaphroditum]
MAYAMDKLSLVRSCWPDVTVNSLQRKCESFRFSVMCSFRFLQILDCVRCMISATLKIGSLRSAKRRSNRLTLSAMSSSPIKTTFLFATLVAVVLCRPKLHHSLGVVDNDQFLKDLFQELDSDGDDLVSRGDMMKVVSGLAQEKGLDEERIIEEMKPHLTFAAFEKLVKDLASPAFDPIKADEINKQKDLTPEESKALEEFRIRVQPSSPFDKKKPRKSHIRPSELFQTYKNVRDADHVEDLFDEADADKDMDLKIIEVVNLMRAYKMNLTNAEALIYFVRAMDERGVIRHLNDFRIFLESAARACHHHVTGILVVNKALRDRCYVPQCLMENEKYRTYPLPNFHSHDKDQVRKAVEFYASFFDDGNSSTRRDFDRLLRSKSFRRQLRNPIFEC